MVDTNADAFERGRQMFRDCVFRPKNLWTDDEWGDALCDGQCVYLGWMFERGQKLMNELRAIEHKLAWQRWVHGIGPLPEHAP